jgi:hypothetical protein
MLVKVYHSQAQMMGMVGGVGPIAARHPRDCH